MYLDPEKAEQLNCETCNPKLQALRNCDGKGTPAKIPLNGSIYTRCPRAIALENYTARYIVNLYNSCTERGMYPYPGGITKQTAFTLSTFDYIDNLISKYHKRKAKEEKNSSKHSK